MGKRALNATNLHNAARDMCCPWAHKELQDVTNRAFKLREPRASPLPALDSNLHTMHSRCLPLAILVRSPSTGSRMVVAAVLREVDRHFLSVVQVGMRPPYIIWKEGCLHLTAKSFSWVSYQCTDIINYKQTNLSAEQSRPSLCIPTKSGCMSPTVDAQHSAIISSVAM